MPMLDTSFLEMIAPHLSPGAIPLGLAEAQVLLCLLGLSHGFLLLSSGCLLTTAGCMLSQLALPRHGQGHPN